MAEEKKETFTIYVDKFGRMCIPRHVRERLGIAKREAEIEVTVKVKKEYKNVEET